MVNTASPDYELLALRFCESAPWPWLRSVPNSCLKRYAKGLTIIRSDQCPRTVKFAREIAEAAREEYGLRPRVVVLKSAKSAQTAPTPYAVFSIIYNGQILADHQISRTRFHNIMKRLVTRGTAQDGGELAGPGPAGGRKGTMPNESWFAPCGQGLCAAYTS